jgi:hypothetical protein
MQRNAVDTAFTHTPRSFRPFLQADSYSSPIKKESFMDLLWILLFVLLCAGIGWLLIACDRLGTERKPTRH